MSNNAHKDFACLLNMLDSIEKIKHYSDSKSFDAVMMNFVVIGEMAEKLTVYFKNSTISQIDWFKIKGFRNIIAHNYFEIDAEEVWQIIQNSIPVLDANIKTILDK